MNQVFQSQTERSQLKQVLTNWKLTPATMAHRLTDGAFIAAPHLLYISARIAMGIQRGNARIIISAPPRHGKSEHTSVHTPVWVLEKYPTKKVILAAYGADLATGFSRRVRDMFTEPSNAALLSTRIRRDASRVEAFLTQQGGGMSAVGLGGPITGRGADVLLIDDYIKEIKEALSQAHREYIWNWFVTTAYTRLEPNASVIVIATRWHTDDLIGRMLREFPGEWDYIELPALAEENDLLGREPGEALFPQRYDAETLADIRKTLGSIFFQALYQQKPVDETNKLTDPSWFKHKMLLTEYEITRLKWARMWDLAATEEGGDYTVGMLQGYDAATGKTYIPDIQRGQWTPEGVERRVLLTAQKDGPNVTIYIEQEPGSAGKALVEHYKRNVLKDYTVVGVPTTTKKLIRLQPFLAATEAGDVFLVGDGDWIKPFKEEFDAFPGGANDDQMDCAGGAYLKLSGKKPYSGAFGRNAASNPTGSAQKNSKNLKSAQINMSQKTRSSVTFGRR